MSKSGVHNGQEVVNGDHDLLNGDAEEKEGKGDPDQGVHHAEHFPRC